MRLSYAQLVLPFFRTMLVGGVLIALALLAGFAVPGPATLARPVAPARGPLIEIAEHPEWKQFLLQAAYRRADELDRLRGLPDTPVIVSKPAAEDPPPVITPDQIAALPPPDATDTMPADLTGSIDQEPAGALPIDIGEASATELPLKERDIQLPVARPETLQRLNDSRRKIAPHRVRARVKPPAQPQAEPDFLTKLFGGQNDQAQSAPSH